MTDWSHLAKGIDVSHYQGAPDWDTVLAGDSKYIMIKCAESGAIDAQFDTNRKAIADKNIPWLPYAFLRPGDTAATIKAFCDAVGNVKIPAAIDWEADNVSATVVERWIDGVQTALNHSPLVYYGLYPPATPTPAIKKCVRWYPQYPGSATADPRLPSWDGQSAVPDWSKRWLIWQWSATDTVSGVPHPTDVNRLSCPMSVFQDWYDNDRLPNGAPATTAPVAALAITQTLQLHSTGDEVSALQQRLQDLGFALSVDSSFGPATQHAVMEFQQSHGLQADGIVGPMTLEALGK
jgi:GH25 family lysozyme M1 (1,4-beta-N-acetylmuramidase)